jgi:hypothetical protein
MCVVTITYDALPIDGTPSKGSTYPNLTFEITVPDGSYVGEMIADGAGFSPCPGVIQYRMRAVSPSGGVIDAGRPFSTCHNLVFRLSTNSCKPASQKYDCINGACVPNITYNTPGLYQSLSECEISCGTGCSGVCISNDDWAQIEGLSDQLKSKNCS